VTNYDPEIAPDPTTWLALDEQQRIRLAEAHHPVAHLRLRNLKVHAVFHAVVENQIAEGLAPVVRAMARLMNEGLSRHDALHAIGSSVAEHLYGTVHAKAESEASTVQSRYNAAVERHSAKKWWRKDGV
jgi:hypothetical protein